MSTLQALSLFKQTFAAYQAHKGQWLAAALAYFTVFAIAPLIVVAAEIAGAALGQHQAVLREVFDYLQRTAGPGPAQAVRGITDAALHQRHSGMFAQVAGWVVFVLAATGLFAALQEALNTLWNVVPQKRGIAETIRERALGFAGIAVMTIVLLASLLINTAITGAAAALANLHPYLPVLFKAADFVLTFVVFAAAFAFLFRYLPDREIDWRDVRSGALMTSALFVIGQFLLGWYFGRAGIGSAYGAFGALAVFLVWANYSAQIVLFGAQFTQVYASQRGAVA